MICWLAIIFIGLSLAYFIKIFEIYLGLYKLKRGTNAVPLPVSVIVPAKNEAPNIRACLDALASQNYPTDQFEVIVSDDHSADGTRAIVQRYVEQYPNIQLLRADDSDFERSGKKQAIARAIDHTRYDIIFTTDADSVAPPDWIRSMMTHFNDRTGMVAGPVVLKEKPSFFTKLQSLEFIGLVSAGAGSIGNGKPVICNGANLAYRKAVYRQVNGFEGHQHMLSGDDDLLMQSIATKTEWNVAFAIEPESRVETAPVPDVFSFLNQRSRWASKGAHYPSRLLVVTLVAAYLYYALISLMLPLALFWPQLIAPFIAGISFKLIADFLLIKKGCTTLNRTSLVKYFLVAEILQVPYILYAGLTGFLGQFKWKDKHLK